MLVQEIRYREKSKSMNRNSLYISSDLRIPSSRECVDLTIHRGSTILRRTARIKRNTMQNDHYRITTKKEGFVPRLFPVPLLRSRDSVLSLTTNRIKRAVYHTTDMLIS